MTASRSQGAFTAREALSNYVLFERHDDIYWLQGRDLDRVRAVTGLRCAEDKAGFDKMTMTAMIQQLRARRIKVSLLAGTCVRTLEVNRLRPTPCNETIQLSPKTLFAERELVSLQKRLRQESSQYERLATSLRVALASEDELTLRELGRLYVYEVAQDMYEVDWRLTTMSESSVYALVKAAYEVGAAVTCAKVEVPSRRFVMQRSESGQPAIHGGPVTYGQIRLPWAM